MYVPNVLTTWADAMPEFRDATGRPGPATWSGGHYPDGQGDFPVSGVSWYEAAAYAKSVGKELPVLGQWYQAASPDEAEYVVPMSNITKMLDEVTRQAIEQNQSATFNQCACDAGHIQISVIVRSLREIEQNASRA